MGDSCLPLSSQGYFSPSRMFELHELMRGYLVQLSRAGKPAQLISPYFSTWPCWKRHLRIGKPNGKRNRCPGILRCYAGVKQQNRFVDPRVRCKIAVVFDASLWRGKRKRTAGSSARPPDFSGKAPWNFFDISRMGMRSQGHRSGSILG